MARAAELNGRSGSAHFGVTKFADWSAEEIRSVFVSAAAVQNATHMHKSAPPPKSGVTFPSSQNYTALGRVWLDVVDQGALASGAAWAMAAEADGRYRLLQPPSGGANGCDLCPCPCDECCMCGMNSMAPAVCRACAAQAAIDCGAYSVPGRVYGQVVILGGWASVTTHPPAAAPQSICGVMSTDIIYIPSVYTQVRPHGPRWPASCWSGNVLMVVGLLVAVPADVERGADADAAGPARPGDGRCQRR